MGGREEENNLSPVIFFLGLISFYGSLSLLKDPY